MRTCFFLQVIFVCLTGCLHAQLWKDILAPSRAVDWSKAGVRSGIPTRTRVCASLKPEASAQQINRAIASCPSGQIVFLNAGTYRLNTGLIARANVTLRGAGPNQTILQFSAPNGCGGETGDICVGGANLYWAGSSDILPGGSHARSWTGGYSRGTTQITLDNTKGLSVGTVLVLDQANDTSETGHFSVCDSNKTIPPCSLEGGAPGRSIGGVTHSQQQYVQVVGVKGKTVTVSPGLYASNWSGTRSPGAFWTDPITGFGIEALTLDHSRSDATAGISFVNADSCWVDNVRSLNGNRSHVWLYLSSHITVQNSYFYGTKNSSVLSYGVEWFLTGDDLVINNIFQHVYSSLMLGPTAGSVIAYSYGVDFYDGPTGFMSPMFQVHDAGNMFNLYEGNMGNQFRADVFHGTTNASTLFRNQLSGFETSAAYPKNSNLSAVNFLSFNRYGNVIGNVLGTRGQTRTYQQAFPNHEDRTVYSLGQSNGRVPGDPTVLPTLLRWGNYDTVNQTARFVSSEVPTSLTDGYANPVPPTPALPASFFLDSKPHWWGGLPWPAIGPDVTGGDMADVGGHAYLIPAARCYLKIMRGAVDGSASVLSYDARSCYPLSNASAN